MRTEPARRTLYLGIKPPCDYSPIGAGGCFWCFLLLYLGQRNIDPSGCQKEDYEFLDLGSGFVFLFSCDILSSESN